MKRYYTTSRGYTYDRAIFWAMFAVIVIYFVWIIVVEGYNTSPHIYIKCDKDRCPNPIMNPTFECKNELKILWLIPIYKDDNCMRNCQEFWCTSEYLSRGEYGRKPPLYIKYIYLIVGVIFIIALLLNHMLYNKGKKIDVEIPISKKTVIRRPHEDKGNSKD